MDSQAFFKISYGLFLISAHEEGRDHACIANTVMQLTAILNLCRLFCIRQAQARSKQKAQRIRLQDLRLRLRRRDVAARFCMPALQAWRRGF